MSDAGRIITPSQTVGPFYAFCLTRHPPHLLHLGDHRLAATDAGSTRVTIEGAMFDGAGAPVPDGLIEVWQADGRGRYQQDGGDSSFRGFGRVELDAEGRFTIETIKPGRVPAPAGGRQAPHVALGIFAKGLNRRLYTRLYFDDEPSNDEDLVLQSVAASRRGTLLSRKVGPRRYQFVIRLQGTDETVFFEA